MSTPYPVPILDASGKVPERLLPDLSPSDPAVAELVENGPQTKAAVLALLGDAVTAAELADILDGYVTPADLAPYATDADLAGKQDRLPWVDVLYSPTAGWANPTPPTGGYRRFDSVLYVDAPPPPTLSGVNGDRWVPHPKAPVWGTL